MNTNATESQSERIRALAQSLDCFTEDDICLLYGISAGTAETWRKRGTGPAHIQAANRPLYPKKSVAEDLQTRVKRRHKLTAKEML